jgi:hypothetical protein
MGGGEPGQGGAEGDVRLRGILLGQGMTMRIQLQTATGEPIHEFDAPRDDAPDIVVWDQRFFVLSQGSLSYTAGKPGWVYREASCHVVPDRQCRLIAEGVRVPEDRPQAGRAGRAGSGDRRFGDHREPPRARFGPPTRREYE